MTDLQGSSVLCSGWTDQILGVAVSDPRWFVFCALHSFSFFQRQCIDSSAPDPLTHSKQLFWDCWSVCLLLPRHAETHVTYSRLTGDLGYEYSKKNYYSHNPIYIDFRNKWLVFEMKNTVVTITPPFLVFLFCLFVFVFDLFCLLVCLFVS